MNWGLATFGAFVLALLAVGIVGPHGGGSAWDDSGPEGHRQLADRLAHGHTVLTIESSLALLPTDTGRGDALLMFPTHRPANPAEVQRVQAFLERGGLLVVAADGANAETWGDALGIHFKGLPALLPPGIEAECIPAAVPLAGVTYELCLPSPTTFPDLAGVAGDLAFTQVAYSGMPVFLDTDLDGKLSAGDQGPVATPLVLEWRMGRGQVVAVADGDVWRNGIVGRHPANLEFAHALVAASGRVFLDSSGVQPEVADRIANPAYRLLAGPGVFGQACVAVVLLGAALLAFRVPRIGPLRIHDPPPDAVDPATAAAAAAILDEFLRGAKTTGRP